MVQESQRADIPRGPLVPDSALGHCSEAHGLMHPCTLPWHGHLYSSLLQLVWLGHNSLSLPQAEDMSAFWVMEHTSHSLWLLLFYNVSNLQVLECLPLTLSGSLSYFSVNKSCFRHCTEQIQFVFMKNSTGKMGSIGYWSRDWALEPTPCDPISVSSLTDSVTLGQWLHFSEPLLPHL